MLSDRSYSQDEYPRNATTALTWVISATVASFVLQFIFLRWFNMSQALDEFMALTVQNVRAGKVWTLLSYSLLHSTGNLLHIVANLLGLYFIGRVLEPILGPRRFLGLFFGAVLAGGLLWLATHWHNGGMAIGASAGVAGLFVVFACFYPNQSMTFLLFFVIPVTLKPKFVAFALLAIELIGFAFYEVMGALSPFGSAIAHSAHLGGMLAGWIYFRFVHDARWSLIPSRSAIDLPRWFKRKSNTPVPAAPQLDPTRRDDLRAEVDRILDKINSEGFGALSPEEKRLLDDARELLSRR